PAGIPNVAGMELDARLQVREEVGLCATARKVIEHHDLLTSGPEVEREVGSDESAATRDEYPRAVHHPLITRRATDLSALVTSRARTNEWSRSWAAIRSNASTRPVRS